MNWLGQHRIALGLIVRRFAGAPFSSLLTMIVIGVTLSLPLGLYVVVENVRSFAGNMRIEPQITVFLSPSASVENLRQVEARLKEIKNIRQYRFIPRDQALRELLQGTGLTDVAAGLDRNPLPDAFVIEHQSLDPAELVGLRGDLAKLPKVDTVQLDTAWAKRLNGMVQLGQDIALLLAVVLGFALVAVTSNTIRLQILSQREEIEISKLIGATDAFIRRPFLYHGAIQGLGGGLAAWLFVALGLGVLNSGVEDLAKLYAANFHLQSAGMFDLLGLLIFASLLGWLGAFLSVSRHLRHLDTHS